MLKTESSSINLIDDQKSSSIFVNPFPQDKDDDFKSSSESDNKSNDKSESSEKSDK